MKLTNKYQRLPCSSIIVLRETRQRTEITTEDLEPSIRRFGVMSPILVESAERPVLIAGERRLAASIKLGLADIPVRFFSDLSPLEAQIVELEENLRRKDLPWRDNCKAIGRIHELYLKLEGEWSQKQTAEALALSPSYIAMVLRIFREIDNPKISQSPTIQTAYGLLSRQDQRRIGDAISDIADATGDIFSVGQGSGHLGAAPAEGVPDTPNAGSAANAAPPGTSTPIPPPTPTIPSPSILHADFTLWAPQYSGPKFNLIHCDFPYGINFNAGPESGAKEWTTYNDSAKVYWTLVDCLCDNLDRIMAASAHLMFWLSADIEIQYKTLQYFRAKAPSLVFNQKPLIWHKSDNVGILSDPKRSPRHIYETCLFASREDRFVVKPKVDTHSSPTDKQHHVSTKPVPMLVHFMEMFVDSHTRMLDPTCGSGAALRAAEGLGAAEVLGLEIDLEHFNNATSALKQFRALRKASGGK